MPIFGLIKTPSVPIFGLIKIPPVPIFGLIQKCYLLYVGVWVVNLHLYCWIFQEICFQVLGIENCWQNHIVFPCRFHYDVPFTLVVICSSDFCLEGLNYLWSWLTHIAISTFNIFDLFIYISNTSFADITRVNFLARCWLYFKIFADYFIWLQFSVRTLYLPDILYYTDYSVFSGA